MAAPNRRTTRRREDRNAEPTPSGPEAGSARTLDAGVGRPAARSAREQHLCTPEFEAGSDMVGVKNPMPGVVYPSDDDLRYYLSQGALTEETLVQAFMDTFARHADGVAVSEPG